jgi:hypothetical protein
MRKVLLASLAIFTLFAFSPLAGTLKWRAHWNLAGSRYFRGAGVYGALLEDPNLPESVRAQLEENLDVDLIAAGAVAPDKWRMGPYYADRSHSATYTRDQGAYWLRMAKNAADNARAGVPGAWDNVSYFLGIAAHYWGDTITMPHHDNARAYYENLYGDELGYATWRSLHNHWEDQVYYHRENLWIFQRGAQYSSLDSYINGVAIPNLNQFILNTKGPGVNNKAGWWFEWVDGSSPTHPIFDNVGVRIEVRFPRDCEATKSSVRLAATLLYNAWIRVLELQSYY